MNFVNSLPCTNHAPNLALKFAALEAVQNIHRTRQHQMLGPVHAWACREAAGRVRCAEPDRGGILVAYSRPLPTALMQPALARKRRLSKSVEVSRAQEF